MSPRAVALLAAVCVGYSCGGGDSAGPPPPPPAEPGPIDFNVTASAGVEHGGLLLTILGGAVDSVTGLAGYEVFHTVTATGARALVFGSIVDGPLVRVWIPDRSQAAQYSVRADEGAVRGTYATVGGDSYSVAHQH